MPGGRGDASIVRRRSASVGPVSVERNIQRDEDQGEDGDEEFRDEGVPFYINRGGLPVDEATWDRMWKHVAKIHPEGEKMVQRIRGMPYLPKVPMPCVPTFQLSTLVPDRLEAIQRYTRELHYLTNNMPGVERFPISFKTEFSGNYFRHIVLGIHYAGRFGTLGMSRREDLMFKPPVCRTLIDLLSEFESSYRKCWHTLKKVKIGQYVSHDPHSVEQIEWKHSVLDIEKLSREELRKELERHTRDMRLKVMKGTAAPSSPTRDRKKDSSSPHRSQSSPHRRNGHSERRSSGEKKTTEQKNLNDVGYQIRV
ncbi:tubulinyl-Tyr carboxypeptidase 1 isoform X2 [Hemiscyllium ocellatum]|uniref:tubulinyl-Tyr carboxypeptidase 1 isoform X2 n=1 Tax=Hemiscyllium ocellatum TaxID=170820 RepID=UPI002966F669|nr:tubulinyl-Tyr carboxypeptidase 1 isoform X2 [Hemiscyllium ocellatum]